MTIQNQFNNKNNERSTGLETEILLILSLFTEVKSAPKRMKARKIQGLDNITRETIMALDDISLKKSKKSSTYALYDRTYTIRSVQMSFHYTFR